MISDKSVEKLLGELSVDIAQRTPGTGDFPTAVEGLELFRRNEPAPPVSCLVPPSIVLVADGAKIMWVGGEPYEYNAEKFLITSLDLPASSEVLQASTSRPCVGVAYKLDQRVLIELIAQGSLPPVKKRDAGTGIRGTFLMNLVFTQHKLNNDKNNNQYVMETPATFPLQ